MMKRTLWLSALCLVQILAFPQRIAFVKGDWEELKAQAGSEGKGIFVDVYTSWCGPCRKMAATVFTDSAVAEFFNARYVSVQLDAEKEAGHAFFREYIPSAYPSFYWLDAKGNLLDSKTGYMPSDSFLLVARNAEKSTLAAEWETCRKAWDDGNRERGFVNKYLFDILPQVRPSEIRPLLNAYLAGLSEEQKADVETGRMVSRFARSIEDDEVFRTLVRYNDKYQDRMDFAAMGKQMYMTLVRVPMADRRDAARYEADMELLRSLEFPSKEMYMNLIEMETLLFDGNYGDGLRRALSLTGQYGDRYPYLCSEICYTLIISRFFCEGRDARDADMALALARKAFDQSPSRCTLAYVAAAHALKGEYKKAYALLMRMPFLGEPTLSNAVYPLLGIE